MYNVHLSDDYIYNVDLKLFGITMPLLRIQFSALVALCDILLDTMDDYETEAAIDYFIYRKARTDDDMIEFPDLGVPDILIDQMVEIFTCRLYERNFTAKPRTNTQGQLLLSAPFVPLDIIEGAHRCEACNTVETSEKYCLECTESLLRYVPRVFCKVINRSHMWSDLYYTIWGVHSVRPRPFELYTNSPLLSDEDKYFEIAQYCPERWQTVSGDAASKFWISHPNQIFEIKVKTTVGRVIGYEVMFRNHYKRFIGDLTYIETFI
jgi:hypothetical protein